MTKANNILETGASSMKAFKDAGWRPKPGFQLRYIYFIDPAARERLTVPVLPFSEIARRGAGMYRGKPRAGSAVSGTPGIQPGRGGATPTPALSSTEESNGQARPAKRADDPQDSQGQPRKTEAQRKRAQAAKR